VDHLDSAIVYRDGLAGLLETQDGQRPSQGDVAQGAAAVNWRSTRSSCTGGPEARFIPGFLAKADQMRCCEHSRATRFSPAAMPCSRSSSAMNR
jgi:hypothetical protein